MSKLKVCFLIPSVRSGGIETDLLRFLNYQDNANAIDATILVRNKSKAELYDAYKATGANLVFKPLGYFNLSNMLWYYRFFKKVKFDTVCDFNANFAGLPMFLSKLAGIKKRIAFYKQGSDHFKKSALRIAYNNLMNRLVYKYSTFIYANSSSGLEFFFPNEYPKDTRFKVIKNGVNVDDFLDTNESKKDLRKRLGLPEDRFVIGHTGRFTEAKNQFFLLDVAAKLIAKDKDIYFVLIGNDTDQLLPYINKLGINDNVNVFGYKNNIPEYLKTFDLFFFPSVTEGLPNALIEAMISGLPIAVSNIPSLVECLPSDRHGCLIDPYNVDSTVEKIIEIKKNPENYVYQKFAIENFDAEVQFGEFMENL
ncbi:glycosyltransferase [Flavobacterium arcticum]|uniref:Glycosyltransferase n=1 Tax=Flavobacterium arcticum TaxID=1784713 RepID=A0A345H990_9FLAO|nr:glycosyltransferase [Flavobacterium arcticum]AXG73150.1 glycosyltransferase [Flavobacterium arcticum]KAF2512942.1 glycosyltransferase family 1 protein [Flavobacterium arcticum]